MMVLRSRIKTFAGLAPRYRSLRAMGVNTAAMTQAAGATSMLYGCELTGVADSMLHDARVAAAHAATTGYGGKNLDRTFNAVDGAKGTADPAFLAHVGPIKAWALAWWERWQPIEELDNAFWSAERLQRNSSSIVWRIVAGPAAAAHASAIRLGWTWQDAHTAVTEAGRVVDCIMDPPAVVTNCSEVG